MGLNAKQKSRILIAVAAVTVIFCVSVLVLVVGILAIFWPKPVTIEGVPSTTLQTMRIDYCPRPNRLDCFSASQGQYVFKYDRNSTLTFLTKTRIKNWNTTPVSFHITASVHYLSATVLTGNDGNRIAVGGTRTPFTLGPGAEMEFALNTTTSNMIAFSNILGLICTLETQKTLPFGTTITVKDITYIASPLPETSFGNSPADIDFTSSCAQTPDNCQVCFLLFLSS